MGAWVYVFNASKTVGKPHAPPHHTKRTNKNKRHQHEAKENAGVGTSLSGEDCGYALQYVAIRTPPESIRVSTGCVDADGYNTWNEHPWVSYCILLR